VETYDIVVVGAGPSGSTVSRLCSMNGLSTLLLEKREFPRPKPCGGFVSEKAMRELDLDIKPVVLETYEKARIFRPKGDYVELESKPFFAVGLSRADLDNFLVEKAISEGVIFRDNERVQYVSISKDRVLIKTDSGLKTQCEIIIGADGVNSFVAQASKLRNNWLPHEVAFCVASEVKLDRNTIKRISPELIPEFHFGLTRTGYGWIFPKGEYLSVGIGALLSESVNSKKLFTTFIRKNPKLKALHGIDPVPHLLPVGGPKRNICTHRTLLIGDAAGFVDPLIGEGIYYAIKSAKLAAITALEAFDEASFAIDSLIRYEMKCEKPIQSDLQYAHSFARKFRYFPNFMLKLFIIDEKLRKSFIDLLKGERTYREFVRGLYWRLPFVLPKYLQ